MGILLVFYSNITVLWPFLSRDYAYCVPAHLPIPRGCRYINVTHRFKEKVKRWSKISFLGPKDLRFGRQSVKYERFYFQHFLGKNIKKLKMSESVDRRFE